MVGDDFCWRACTLVASLLLCAMISPVAATDCAVAVTLRSEAEFAAFTCNGGISAGLTLNFLPNATSAWTFPTVTKAAYLSIASTNPDAWSPAVFSVSFPNLVAVTSYINVDIRYFSNLTSLLLPKLQTVVRAGVYLPCLACPYDLIALT
jgi:hypothetical protein